ncbi:hypothetical protein CEXT_290271, partial [Caerostris extrusa]
MNEARCGPDMPNNPGWLSVPSFSSRIRNSARTTQDSTSPSFVELS